MEAVTIHLNGKNKVRSVLFASLVLLTLNCTSAFCQEFAIRKMELGAGQVTVHYDLIDTVRDRLYTVYLYSSKDNFIAPLEKVTGDHGLRVKPGMNRKIVWQAKEELGPTFQGDVELEVRGKLYVPFLQVNKFNDVQARQREFMIKWSGGNKQSVLNFQLHDANGKLVYVFPNIVNNNEHKITIPRSIKPEKGYYFRIADAKNKDQAVETQAFEIKRKYSIGLKTGVVVAVAGLTYIVWELLDEDVLDGPPDHPPDP